MRSGERQPAGAARWLVIHDELLRGIAHTLSNRVATIDAAACMLEFEGADVMRHAATLRSETVQLEELLQALRILPHRADTPAEPVMPHDAVRAALAVHSHHGDLHGVPCDVEIASDVMPGYADPLALQHALLVGLSTAGRAAKAQRLVNGAGRVLVHVTGSGDTVQFAITAADVVLLACEEVEHDAESDAAAVAWLLGTHDGRSTAHNGGAAFTIPTLAAARRRGL